MCKQGLSQHQRELTHVSRQIEDMNVDLGYYGPSSFDDPLSDLRGLGLIRHTGLAERTGMNLSTEREPIRRQKVVIKRLMAEFEDERIVAARYKQTTLDEIITALTNIEGGYEIYSCANYGLFACHRCSCESISSSISRGQEWISLNLLAKCSFSAISFTQNSISLELTQPGLAVALTPLQYVLDTPFFDWDSDSSRLISIPLTIAILMI